MSSFEKLFWQPFGGILFREDVGADLLQRAERLGFVDVPGETDLVADLGGTLPDPGVRGIGQYLASNEGCDAASSSSGTCSVSRKSLSDSYSTTQVLPSMITTKRP